MGTVKFLHRQVGESGNHGDIYRGTLKCLITPNQRTDESIPTAWFEANPVF